MKIHLYTETFMYTETYVFVFVMWIIDLLMKKPNPSDSNLIDTSVSAEHA